MISGVAGVGEAMVVPVEYVRSRTADGWADAPNDRLGGLSPAAFLGDGDVLLNDFVRVLEAAVADGVDRNPA